MNQKENSILLKVVSDIAEMKTDLKYVKDHVGVMNAEFGRFQEHCEKRLFELEECNRIRAVKKSILKQQWKKIISGLGGVAAFLTVLYYVLVIFHII
jgi:hypothetical protein